MLARAVVVERRRLLDRARLVDQRILFGGPVRAAFERRDITTGAGQHGRGKRRSEEHTSELQSLIRISYAVFCLKKKKKQKQTHKTNAQKMKSKDEPIARNVRR